MKAAAPVQSSDSADGSTEGSTDGSTDGTQSAGTDSASSGDGSSDGTITNSGGFTQEQLTELVHCGATPEKMQIIVEIAVLENSMRREEA